MGHLSTRLLGRRVPVHTGVIYVTQRFAAFGDIEAAHLWLAPFDCHVIEVSLLSRTQTGTWTVNLHRINSGGAANMLSANMAYLDVFTGSTILKSAPADAINKVLAGEAVALNDVASPSAGTDFLIQLAIIPNRPTMYRWND